MKKLVAGGFTAALISALAVVTVPTGSQAADQRAAQPQDASARAAQSARALVANRPPRLHASRHDTFRAQDVQSSGGLQYVPYERTYRGLPVIGGDFVVATDAAGTILARRSPRPAPRRCGREPDRHPRRRRAPPPPASSATRDASSAPGWSSSSARAAPGLGDHGHRHPRRRARRGSPWTSTRATGKVLRTQEHVLHGTGTGGVERPQPAHPQHHAVGQHVLDEGPGRSPTRAARTPRPTRRSPARTTSGATARATNKETGCVDALLRRPDRAAKMLVQWLGRNGMDGTGGGWPIRVGLNDSNAYYDGTQVQIGHNTAGQWIGSIDVVAHEIGHGIDDHTPGGISGSGTQEFVADIFGARPSGSPTSRRPTTRPTSWSARRSTWSARPDPQHVQPVGARRPELLLQLDPEHRGARRGRPGQPLVLPAGRGQQPDQRPADQPDLQRQRRSPASASRTPSRSCTTRC